MQNQDDGALKANSNMNKCPLKLLDVLMRKHRLIETGLTEDFNKDWVLVFHALSLLVLMWWIILGGVRWMKIYTVSSNNIIIIAFRIGHTKIHYFSIFSLLLGLIFT